MPACRVKFHFFGVQTEKHGSSPLKYGPNKALTAHDLPHQSNFDRQSFLWSSAQMKQ
jgi:hypothetical protein